MKHIWACECRTQTECRAEDVRLGAVFQCPGCKVIWGNVRPRRGANAWIRIDQKDADFHRLLEEPEEEPAEAPPSQTAGAAEASLTSAS